MSFRVVFQAFQFYLGWETLCFSLVMIFGSGLERNSEGTENALRRKLKKTSRNGKNMLVTRTYE